MPRTRASADGPVTETPIPLGLSHVIVPSLVAMVLAAPCFNFPFLWDDFDFLGRGQHLRLSDLLPDRQTVFYRPLSRELYFGLLDRLGASPFVGHLLNLIGLVAVVYLLNAVVRRVAGARAGVFAGIVFAGLGALPLLVGWVSGIQDLLAMISVLGAIHLGLRGRAVAAPCIFLCALLAKESALSFLPAAVYAGRAAAGSRGAAVRTSLIYGAFTLAWAAIHPAPRLLMEGKFGGSSDGYLAALSTPQVGSLLAGLLTMMNIAIALPKTVDPKLFLPVGAGLVALALFGLRWERSVSHSPAPDPERRVHILLLAGLMIVPPLLTSLLLRYWAPYQACMPALGFSVLAGPYLAKARARTAIVLVAGYLCMGLCVRAESLAPTVTTESNVRETGLALTAVERGFKQLHQEFPESSHIYVSAQLGGASSIYHHLYRYQPHRVWYKDPSLFVLHPYSHLPGSHSEFLFWVTPQFEVIEIDLRTLRPRTYGRAPELIAYQKALRRYALGRAAEGRVDEAVRILTTLPETSAFLQAYDRRIAAAVLIAAGRDSDAEHLLRGVAEFSREPALDSIMEALHESAPDQDLADATMRAFGISPQDFSANRSLLRAFEKYGFAEPAVRFARRTLVLTPNDPDALRVLRRWAEPAEPVRITVPIPHD